MKVYWTVCVLTLLIAYLMPYDDENQCKKRMIFTFIPLFLFGALRVDFGNDYPAYEAFWQEIHNGAFAFENTQHLEMGYQLLNYLMPSYRSILVLNSFLLCLALGVFLYRNVPPKYLGIALILMFLNPEKNIYGSLVGIRNGLVVSGFLLSFFFIQMRKLVPFAITTVFLMQFHTSAVLFMPVAYFVANNNELTRREILIWVICLAVLLAFSVSELIEIVTPFVSTYLDRYETYLNAEKHRGYLEIIANIIFIILLFIGFYTNKGVLTDKQNSLYRMGLVYLASAFLGTLSMRASYFYDMFFIATIANMFSVEWKQPSLKWCLLGFALVVSWYSTFVVWMGSQWWDHEVYHSIISL